MDAKCTEDIARTFRPLQLEVYRRAEKVVGSCWFRHQQFCIALSKVFCLSREIKQLVQKLVSFCDLKKGLFSSVMVQKVCVFTPY